VTEELGLDRITRAPAMGTGAGCILGGGLLGGAAAPLSFSPSESEEGWRWQRCI